MAILRGGAMSRWVGRVAVAVFQLARGRSALTPNFGILAYIWIVAVGGYYTNRPPLTRELVAGPAQRSVATGAGHEMSIYFV
ncbi:MAG: hypothetical protein NVS1B3_00690 [Candidatus Dormibacteraceae bacterium]